MLTWAQVQNILEPEDAHGHARGHVVCVLRVQPRAQQPPHAAQAPARPRRPVPPRLLLLQQGLQATTDAQGSFAPRHRHLPYIYK